MTREDERKVLLNLLSYLDQDVTEGLLQKAKRQLIAWGTGVLFAVVFLGVFIEPNIYKVLLGIVAYVTGAVMGITAYRRGSAKQWPAVVPFIDRSQVEARLRELDV
jgi:hypothetical protein